MAHLICRGVGSSIRIRTMLPPLGPLLVTSYLKKESCRHGRVLQKMTRSFEWTTGTTGTTDGATTTTSSTLKVGVAAVVRAEAVATTLT